MEFADGDFDCYVVTFFLDKKSNQKNQDCTSIPRFLHLKQLKKCFCSETRCAQTTAQKHFFAYGTLFLDAKIGIELRSARSGKL